MKHEPDRLVATSDLERRLRADADAFRAAPSAALREHVRAAVERTEPGPTRRRRYGRIAAMAAAVLLIASLANWKLSQPRGTVGTPGDAGMTPFEFPTLDTTAFRSSFDDALRREADLLSHDVTRLTDGVLASLPKPLRASGFLIGRD